MLLSVLYTSERLNLSGSGTTACSESDRGGNRTAALLIKYVHTYTDSSTDAFADSNRSAS